jgi:protein O-mannosyl-transferase
MTSRKTSRGCGWESITHFKMHSKPQTRVYLYIFLIVISCLVVYGNTLNNAFISDDFAAIVNNPDISHLRLFPVTTLSNLVDLSFKFNYQMGGLKAPVYHLTNILIHALSSVLVFFFLRLFFKPEGSFWGALIFAVHPIHTEAVTWISGRGYALAAVFMFSSLLFYAAATREKRLNAGKLLSSLFFYILAMFSCTLAWTFPAIIALYDLTIGKTKNWRLWLAFLALTLVKLFFILGLIGHRVSTFQLTNQTHPANPVLITAYSLSAHLKLLLWPLKLTLYHEPPVMPRTLLDISVVYFFLIALALFFAYRRAKPVFFGLGTFVIFLAPTYSPVQVASILAERYIYFPSIALSIFLVFLYEKYTAKFRPSRKYFLAAFVLLTAAFGARTVVRNEDWKAPQIFWQKTIAAFPNSVRAHSGLGINYLQEGDLNGAIEEFNRAIEIKPYFVTAYIAEAHYNRGLAYYRQGNLAQALSDYNQAIQINPTLATAYNNRGLVYADLGNSDLALLDYNQAIQISPDFSEAYNNRGMIYFNQGNFEQALSDYGQAIQINPDRASFYYNRGLAYLNQGDFAPALSDFNQAIKINPRLFAAYNCRGLVYSWQNNLDQALPDFNQAIKINPEYAAAYYNRGMVYFLKKDYNSSWQDWRLAGKLGYRVDPALIRELRKIGEQSAP